MNKHKKQHRKMSIFKLLEDQSKLEFEPLMLESNSTKDPKTGKILFSLDELELNQSWKHTETGAVLTRINEKQVKCQLHKEEKLFTITTSKRATETTKKEIIIGN